MATVNPSNSYIIQITKLPKAISILMLLKLQKNVFRVAGFFSNLNLNVVFGFLFIFVMTAPKMPIFPLTKTQYILKNEIRYITL